MKTIFASCVLGITMLGLFCQPAGAISAFPGAEGFGANSIGGRGGKILKVTNLNDSGAGSFRAAVEANGPRIVVFDISGVINLTGPINVLNPYLTIAGETSPGGICIAGYTVTLGAHDIIVRHMRFRVGSHRVTDGSNADPETLDSLDIWGDTVPGGGWSGNNIIIDHCSISWGVDETFSISYDAKNVTVQWSIVSEGLSEAGHPKGEHSKGLLVSGKSGAPTVSLHHNYIAHNTDRNPLIGAGTEAPVVDVVNNVVYNWKGSLSMKSQNLAHVNWVHNYLKKGPASNTTSFEASHYPNSLYPVQPMIYVEGNLGLRRLNQTDPQWTVGLEYRDIYLDKGYQATTRWNAPPISTSIISPSVADCILTAVGATAPVRDSVDKRVVGNFANGDGAIPLNVKFPDDYATYQNIAPPTDADNDGMADSWEVANGLNPAIDDSSQDRDNDGYTNIEEYLHFLSDKSYTFDARCMEANVPVIKGIILK